MDPFTRLLICPIVDRLSRHVGAGFTEYRFSEEGGEYPPVGRGLNPYRFPVQVLAYAREQILERRTISPVLVAAWRMYGLRFASSLNEAQRRVDAARHERFDYISVEEGHSKPFGSADFFFNQQPATTRAYVIAQRLKPFRTNASS